MIYLWKMFIEWAVEYPESAFICDIVSVGVFIVIIATLFTMYIEPADSTGVK